MKSVEHLKDHYYDILPDARQRLEAFQKERDYEDVLAELTFCVFAANSSAKMGLKAEKLLRPVLHEGDAEVFRKQVSGKVRFYNVRSEYMAYNVRKASEIHLERVFALPRLQRRDELVQFFKGIGYKEGSHFLRNLGFEGYAILDKHVRTILHDLDVFETKRYPSSREEYLALEREYHDFADRHGFNADVLDLALWSAKTGEIIK